LTVADEINIRSPISGLVGPSATSATTWPRWGYGIPSRWVGAGADFVPIGKRALKGVAEEVDLYRVGRTRPGRRDRHVDPVCGVELPARRSECPARHWRWDAGVLLRRLPATLRRCSRSVRLVASLHFSRNLLSPSAISAGCYGDYELATVSARPYGPWPACLAGGLVHHP
jgi:hypothetical protein